MEKGNGSNNIPGWVRIDLQMLKRVSVSLVEMAREARQDRVEMRLDIAETRRQMIELHNENRRRIAGNEKILTDLRKTSAIHSKAILKMLKKI